MAVPVVLEGLLSSALASMKKQCEVKKKQDESPGGERMTLRPNLAFVGSFSSIDLMAFTAIGLVSSPPCLGLHGLD